MRMEVSYMERTMMGEDMFGESEDGSEWHGESETDAGNALEYIF